MDDAKIESGVVAAIRNGNLTCISHPKIHWGVLEAPSGKFNHGRIQIEGVHMRHVKLCENDLCADASAAADLENTTAGNGSTHPAEAWPLEVPLDPSAQGIVHQQEFESV